MTYRSDPKFGPVREFDSAEECLRYEGALMEAQRRSDSGCLWLLLILGILGVILFG